MMFHATSCDAGLVTAIYKEVFDILSPSTKKLLEDCLICASCSKKFDSAPCNCGVLHPGGIILDYSHREDFGQPGTCWGIYKLSEANMEILAKAMKRDRFLILENYPYLARYGSKDSVQAVQNWLDDTFPENNLVVKPIMIPAVNPPDRSQKKLIEIFDACFRNSETKLHGYLKWFAFCHVSKGSDLFYCETNNWDRGVVTVFEANYYLPGSRVIKKYDGGKGRVVPTAWLDKVRWSDRIRKIADIYSGPDDLIVECGLTDSQSLVAPIKAKVVKRVIWLQYPKGIDKNELLSDFDFECQAYLIHTKQPSHLRHIPKNPQ